MSCSRTAGSGRFRVEDRESCRGLVYGWITRDRPELEAYFYALDAETGREWWRINLGGDMSSSAITYAVNGKQAVAMPAGSGIFAFALP